MHLQRLNDGLTQFSARNSPAWRVPWESIHTSCVLRDELRRNCYPWASKTASSHCQLQLALIYDTRCGLCQSQPVRLSDSHLYFVRLMNEEHAGLFRLAASLDVQNVRATSPQIFMLPRYVEACNESFVICSCTDRVESFVFMMFQARIDVKIVAARAFDPQSIKPALD